MTEQYSFQEIEDLRAEIDRLRAENELLRDTKGCTILDQQEEIDRLRAERDELIAAAKAMVASCKAYFDTVDDRMAHEAFRAARAAVAKVEGKP